MTTFTEKFPPLDVPRSVEDSNYAVLSTLTGYARPLEKYSDMGFDGGIYYLYGGTAINAWTELIGRAFPTFRGRVLCFGRDWMGNHFCLDKQRSESGEPLVLLFEVGTGKVLELPATYESFHSSLSIQHADAVFAESLYRRWKALHPEPIRIEECVGYVVPLFLGGKDDVENLEKSNLSVYWHLMTELLAKTNDLPRGAKISSVSSA